MCYKMNTKHTIDHLTSIQIKIKSSLIIVVFQSPSFHLSPLLKSILEVAALGNHMRVLLKQPMIIKHTQRQSNQRRIQEGPSFKFSLSLETCILKAYLGLILSLSTNQPKYVATCCKDYSPTEGQGYTGNTGIRAVSDFIFCYPSLPSSDAPVL